MPLKFRALKPTDKDATWHHDVLPVLPATILMIGPTRCGKTCSLVNLVLSKEMYRDAFKDGHYWVISPTWENCTSLRHLHGIEGIRAWTEYSDDHIKEIIDTIESQPPGERRQSLLIVDDCLGTAALNRHSALSALVSRTRHYRLSIIITSQLAKGIPPTVRNNAMGVMIWNQNSSELHKTMAELHDMFGAKEYPLEKMLEDATAEKWTFLYLDLKRQRAWKLGGSSDEKLLWEKKDE